MIEGPGAWPLPLMRTSLLGTSALASGAALAFENMDQLSPRLQEVRRVLRLPVDADFIVQVASSAPTRTTYNADFLAKGHMVALPDADFLHVGVAGRDAEAVIDDHHVAIGAIEARLD